MVKAFGGFRLDPVNQCLWHADRRIALAPKPFAVLEYLVNNPRRLVTQDELLEALWPETYVQPEILRTYILELRKALGDPAKDPRFIATYPKRGYEFLVPVTTAGQVPEPLAAQPRAPIGREDQIAELLRDFEGVRKRRRQVTFVTGEAGIGKTTVVDAFERSVTSQPGVRIARGQCVEGFGGKEAYYPVFEALSQLLNGPTGGEIAHALSQKAPTWLVQFPSLIEAGEHEAIRREILGATRERMLREICEALEVLTAESPLVLILEDLHWADYSTLDLISALARRRGPARLLVIATYRTIEVLLSKSPLKALKQDLLIHSLCHEIALEGLTLPGVEQYLTAEFPEANFPAEFAGMVHRHSGGNPMFLAAITSELKKSRLLRRDQGCWTVAVPLKSMDLGVPDTLNQMLDLQIEQLDPQEQKVLKCGAVAGQRFSAWAISCMVDLSVGVIEQVCEDLGKRHQFIQRGNGHPVAGSDLSTHYEFRHSLYREALYRQLAPALRAGYHRNLASKMESLWPAAAGTGDLASELALHFEQGRDHQRAAHYLLLSAENAARRFAHRDAVQSLAHALDLLARVTSEPARQLEVAVLEKLSDAHYAMGEMNESAEADRRAAELAAEIGMKTAQIDALTRLARPLAFLDPDGCVTVCQRAEEISATHNDPLLHARTRMLAACWRVVNNGWNVADSRICAEARETIGRGAPGALPAYYEILYAHVQSMQGEYPDALDTADAGIAKSIETHSLVVHLSALSSKTLALLHLGRWGELRRVTQTAIDMAVKNGNQPWEGVFRAVMAWLSLNAMDLEGAQRQARDLLKTHDGEPLGQVGTMALITASFADMQTGQAARAVENFLRVRNRAAHPKFFLQWYWKLVAQRGLVSSLIELGELDRAKQEAGRFLEAALTTADPALKALAWESQARVSLDSGEVEAARQQIEPALAALKPVEPPAAAWRIHWTAAMIYRQAGDPGASDFHQARARAILRELADSFDADDPLRGPLLEAAARKLPDSSRVSNA